MFTFACCVCSICATSTSHIVTNGDAVTVCCVFGFVLIMSLARHCDFACDLRKYLFVCTDSPGPQLLSSLPVDLCKRWLIADAP